MFLESTLRCSLHKVGLRHDSIALLEPSNSLAYFHDFADYVIGEDDRKANSAVEEAYREFSGRGR